MKLRKLGENPDNVPTEGPVGWGVGPNDSLIGWLAPYEIVIELIELRQIAQAYSQLMKRREDTAAAFEKKQGPPGENGNSNRA